MTRPRLVVARAETAAIPLPALHSRRGIIAVGVAAAALAAAGVWAWAKSGPAPHPYEPVRSTPSARAEATAPKAITETPTPPATGDTPTATTEQKANETPKAVDRIRAVRAIDPSTLPRVTGVVSRPQPAPTTERVTSAPKATAPEPTPEVKPRDGYSKTNPYR